MTPAYVLSQNYFGLVTGRTLADTIAAVAPRLSTTPGWALRVCRGTEQPPLGAVLIGALVADGAGECDHNFYVYPYVASCGVLQDSCRGHAAG